MCGAENTDGRCKRRRWDATSEDRREGGHGGRCRVAPAPVGPEGRAPGRGPSRRKGIRFHRSSGHAAYDRVHGIHGIDAFRPKLDDSECIEQTYHLRNPGRSITVERDPHAEHRPPNNPSASTTFGLRSESTHREGATLAQGVVAAQPALFVHNQAQGQGEGQGSKGPPSTEDNTNNYTNEDDNDNDSVTDDPD